MEFTRFSNGTPQTTILPLGSDADFSILVAIGVPLIIRISLELFANYAIILWSQCALITISYSIRTHQKDYKRCNDVAPYIQDAGKKFMCLKQVVSYRHVDCEHFYRQVSFLI